MNKEKKSSTSLSWADLAKKVVYASLGSAAMAKQVVSNSQWQKDLVGGLLSVVEKRKEDLMEILAREVSKFLGKINVSEEITKSLKGLIINLNATVDFKEKKEKGLHPKIHVRKAHVYKTSN